MPSRRELSTVRAAGALVLALLAPAAVALAPRSGTVAVLGPPWAGGAGAARIVAAAGGAILRAGRFDNLLITTSPEPGFARRLYAAGAWLVVSPLLAGACAPSPSQPLTDSSPR
ncbi:hypothetical protein [Methylobacterium nonmethylotrophicum]|uniref:Uncharacterized protein n=1 Tax=Methylobacterium nonmethylotrophicum TaxID=1141884 RepID=A0A4Z0NEW3_9HYPH|nr:hypothetical protein [Methylobacterium nonmethylotrophicum]TGD93165.1 hypothetical protein EU555_33720 [Methylobacterium nonmethylotrophicum]